MPLFKFSNILTVPYLCKLHISLFVHDWTNKRLPESFENIFAEKNHKSQTRHGALYRTAPRTKFSANLPKHMYPQIWNNLPEATKNITSRKIFKNTLKSNMLKNITQHLSVKTHCAQIV